jgi:hypothetical protein
MGREEKDITLLGTAGKISFEEEQLARSVFGDQLPYGRIWLGKEYLKGATAAVTVATSPRGGSAEYVICWGDPVVYANGADHGDDKRATFIHELTHVWQGHHGYSAMGYMVGSIFAQGWHGVKDIIKHRRYSDWDRHRSKAYVYSMNDIGKPWTSFNVEQQGNIVEDWFRANDYRNADGVIIKGGNMSPDDPRYPYIVYNIRTGKQGAGYIPITRQAAQVQHPAGYSPEIAEYQEILFSLGYLTDRKYVDGFMGNTTRRAVTAFQKRNNLIPADGDIGGVNSRTRAKLKENPATLRRAQ